jgi:outer membrane protein assembly factor BamB
MHDFEDKDLPEDDKIEISDLDTPDERKKSSPIYRLLKRISEIHLSPLIRTRLFVLALLLGGGVLAYQFIPFPHSKTTANTHTISYGSIQLVADPAINVSVANGIAYIFTEGGMLNAQRASDGKLLWQSNVPISSSAQPTTQPIIVDNLVFLVAQNALNGHIEVLRASDGILQWSFQTPALATQPLVIKDGVVYILTHTGTIYALGESKGNQLWQFAARETISQSSDVLYASNGVTAVLTNKQVVYLLNTQNGSQLWHYTTNPPNTPISWYPEIEGDIAYIHTNTDSLQARSLSDGHTLWQYTEPLGLSSMQNGIIYVYTLKNASLKALDDRDGSLTALDGRNGSLLWQRNDISDWNAQQPGIVFIMQTNGLIEALQAQDGSLLWQFKPPTPGSRLSGVKDGLLYVTTTTSDMTIFALRTTNGSMLWDHILSNADINFAPTITDDALYLRQNDGSFAVWNLHDGHMLWHYQSSVPISQGPTEVDGLVYIRQEDGIVNLLRARDGKVVWSYSLSLNP